MAKKHQFDWVGVAFVALAAVSGLAVGGGAATIVVRAATENLHVPRAGVLVAAAQPTPQDARQAALSVLGRFGIDRLAGDTQVDRFENEWQVIGHCRSAAGDDFSFATRHRSNEAEGVVEWQTLHVELDGHKLFEFGDGWLAAPVDTQRMLFASAGAECR